MDCGAASDVSGCRSSGSVHHSGMRSFRRIKATAATRAIGTRVNKIISTTRSLMVGRDALIGWLTESADANAQCNPGYQV